MHFIQNTMRITKIRTVILGINPGRLGAGITGISFTDPEKLQNRCHIKNDFNKKEELSSKFVYQWLSRGYTVKEFYRNFIILSVCPLGFISNGKNINYYDDKTLMQRATKLIVKQQDLLCQEGRVTPRVYMLGKGKNYQFFTKLNDKFGWYDEVIPLPHPRWVMQYRFHHRFEIMDEMLSKLTQSQ